jgi:acetyl esterase/lipase
MEDLLQLRESYDRKILPYDNEPTVSITQETVEGISCYWFTPQDPAPDRVIIFLHGGGFAMGSVKSHGKMTTHFAKNLQATILFIEYALAPEHPFPAGLDDIIAVYRAIVNRYPGYQLTLIGDSAGGSLIVSAIGEMLKMDLSLPRAVVLISPLLSFTCDNPSYEENALLDVSLTRDMLRMFVRAYTGDVPIEVSSPKNATLTRFPPVLIMVGSHEILLDDSRHFYTRIKEIQPRSRLSIYEGQPHVWPKKDILKEASRQAVAEILEFIASAP